MHQKQHGRPSTSFSCQPQYESGKRMLYTGPDYIRDYRPRLPDCTRYVGEGMPSFESTSEVNYLCRAAPGTPAPLPKECYVGGIGWGVSDFTFLNRSQLCSNHQIKSNEIKVQKFEVKVNLSLSFSTNEYHTRYLQCVFAKVSSTSCNIYSPLLLEYLH
uniref:Uncharacterized protein n=1 Tax=Pyxicephalus adspersus TaxID=30357 RepID=A0AAV3AQV5_PYXAD|nr:TPA: hypothetical protein GDO54_009319 [Pyxicephalus adspersus]